MSYYRIDKLFNFEKGTLQSSKCEEGKYNFITASSEWKKHTEYSYDCEALVFAAAASGSLGRTHYVKGKFIASDLCFIITPKDPINFPIDLKFYHIIFNVFKKDIVKNTKAGTSKEAIGLAAFGKYELPYFEIEKQIEIKNQFVNSEEANEELSKEFIIQLDLLKQLRQSFLREAMQGKLAKQYQKEGNATDLLKKIKAEKEKLIAEKKLKKEAPLHPVQEEEIPFEIPENWVWCRLGEICVKIGSGSTPKGSNYSKSGFPFFRSQNIYSEGLVYDDITFVSHEVQNQMKGTRVMANDILLNITGGSLGRCALVPNNFKEGNVSQHVCIIRPVCIDNNFLHNVVLSPFFQKFIFSSTTGAGREGLPKYNLEQFLIPLPPVAEQKRIVKKLEEVMNLCEELKTTITDNQNYTNQLLQVALKDALQMKEVEIAV